MSELHRAQITYRYERWRAISSGILETAGTTFLLLIAVRWFHAGQLPKAFIAGGGSLGLALSPLLVSSVRSSGWSTSRAASRFAAFGALCILVTALVPTLPVFVIGSALALTTVNASIPLLTQIYHDNYPANERGRLFSRTFVIRLATTVAFTEGMGKALDGHLERFRWMLFVFAVALGFSSFCLSKIPSRPLTSDKGTHPFRALRFVRDDALFRRTLICWMLMGFANLMMAPLRVEYLANPKYGLHLSVSAIAMFVGVLPNIVRLIMSPVWGHLFDRMNFFMLRIILNIGFALGIAAFFTTASTTGLVVGGLFYGIANAGGDVAWSLWVTKFAPADRVADYMSVHTFFTGVRGLLAPVAGFLLVEQLSLPVLGWISVALIVAATALLVPEIKFAKKAKAAAPMIEGVSD